MPLGKGRSRRSGSSSTPVITTIAFVALCVLGVWLLASTPVTPTTTAKTAAATASSFASSVINFRKTIISDDASKITTPFEDLPGDLPENGGSSSSSSEISNDSQSGENEKEGVTEKEMADQENGGSVKNQESAASEGLHGKETEEEHKELETQTSEESTLTQQKEIETIKQNVDKDVSEPEKREENATENQKSGSEETTKVQDSQTNSQESSEENKNLISDEDQRKRLEHHQQQEDDQLQQKQQSQPEILETRKDPMKAWMTQADQSVNQKERKDGADNQEVTIQGQNWQLCNVTPGPDYIPCLDNEEALAKIRGRQHFEHRERHCPAENPVCLVPFSRWRNSVYPWSTTLH